MDVQDSPDSASRSTAGLNAGAGPTAGETVLRQALRVLEPLVRLLMTHGVTYPQLAEALKSVFVRETLQAARVPSRMTDSTIAVATGIHRKDVKRLRADAALAAAGRSDSRQSLVSAVFTHWLADPAYRDAGDRPIALTRQGDDARSFETLVRKVSTDVHPRTVLNELLRLRLVDVDDDNVRLKVDSFVPNEDFAQLLDYLGANLHDHAAAAVCNVLGADGPFLEQSVFSSTVAPWAVDELANAAREQWNGVVRNIVPEIASREVAAGADDDGEKSGAAPGQTAARVRLGMYFYAERGAPGPAASATTEKRSST